MTHFEDVGHAPTPNALRRLKWSAFRPSRVVHFEAFYSDLRWYTLSDRRHVDNPFLAVSFRGIFLSFLGEPPTIRKLKFPPSSFGIQGQQKMKRSRFSEEQIIGILREAKAGSPIKAVCGSHNISTATYHAWKRKFGELLCQKPTQTCGATTGHTVEHPVQPSARRFHLQSSRRCAFV
jgi:Transposase